MSPAPADAPLPPDRAWAEERLRNSHNYWLATTRADGRPHLVPIWGVWLEQRFWFSSFAGVEVDNIAACPTVVLTTETPGEVVILDGTAETVGVGDLPEGYARTFDAKYGPGWSGIDDERAVLLRVLPVKARAWRESDATDPPARFAF